MAIAQSDAPTLRQPLRLWPGVLILTLQWLVRFVLPVVAPQALMAGVLGEFVGALLILVWWAFFSRAPITERWGAIVLMVVALFVTRRLPFILHPSIVGGMMGMMFFLYAIPVLCLALVVWAVATRNVASAGPRRAALVVAIALACGVFALLRTGGITGEADSDLHWRWTASPEDRLLAQSRDEPAARPAHPEHPAISAGAPAGADWPGFRGPERNDAVPGARIKTDWAQSPPVELWRRPIGPGWSSFAVHGDLLYTQEQRGEDEIVSCYRVMTGEPVWKHRDAARFYESNAGAGPRGTPTLSNGRVYTFGATGIVNALDAADGKVVWSHNAGTDTGKKVPGWGFASSPLVVGDVVIVSAAGALVAYDAATGERRWLGPSGGGGYSSPHLVTLDGVAQILLLNGKGAISVAPADGKVLWEYRWPGDGIVQPALTADGGVLIGNGSGMNGGMGVRRIAVAKGPGRWNVQEGWTSMGLKPYFNDLVVHKGHAYGFDGGILSSIDLKDGQRTWKGGRYGHGQLLLLPDQDLLLVLSEQGELALVKAVPDQFAELARFKAVEGKTWNHPVLVGDVLLVRNGQEMVAFRLARAERS
jgi:outer membrane protein assembly factor BamB